jgi:hypothetical protein
MALCFSLTQLEDLDMIETFIHQRKKDDCGVAALATLLGVSYFEIEIGWRGALDRGPNASSYKDLIAVGDFFCLDMERVPFSKTIGSKRIVRVRQERGSSHSHWIVMYPDESIWCPWYGRRESLDCYEMPFPGQALWIKR